MQLPRTPIKFVLYFTKQQWVKFSLFASASIAWGVNDAIFPYLLKKIVNTLNSYRGVPGEVYHALGGALLLVVVFWVCGETMSRIQGLIQVYAFPKFRASIREATFNYVESHSHTYFANNFAGTIANKISDLPTNCQTILETLAFQFITASVGALIVFATMWTIKPIFALVLILWLVIHIGITFIFLRKGNQLLETHSSSVTTLSGKIVDAFTNIQNVKLFAREKYESRYLNRFQKEEVKKSEKAQLWLEFMRMGFAVNGLSLILGMLFLLIHGWIHHWVSMGDFTQVAMQSFWLLGWMWYVSFQLTIFARTKATIASALSLIQKSHDIVDKDNAKKLIVKQGEICFSNVCFSYNRKRFVFDNLNVKIMPGQKVGLVGFSGSGKSSFVNLILRFYDLKSGEILIDDQSIA
ncbi:MAG TPA: ABC transporter ATP-binding protein, partial [Coxiellaceae bacterium]|nr:ABC transporter ATP-binding protein [Coxiellaceae bacterium]